jgi:hypothetical protein
MIYFKIQKNVYIPHVLEVKTWIKADLKRYMEEAL